MKNRAQSNIAIFILTSLFALFASALSADGGRFKVEPEVGEWSHSFCKGTYYPSDSRPYCLLYGGDWVLGSNGRYECVGSMNIEELTQWRIDTHSTEQAEQFIAFRSTREFCQPVEVDFSGWQILPSNAVCRNKDGNAVSYKYGVTSGETGNMPITYGTTDPSSNECEVIDLEYGAHRNRDVSCPSGSSTETLGDPIDHYCYKECSGDEVVVAGQCIAPEKSCNEDAGVGNPCDPRTGIKFQTEHDFSDSGLSFSRHYSSHFQTNIGMGMGWNHQWSSLLSINIDKDFIFLVRKTRGEIFRKVDGVWQGDADSDYSLTEQADGHFIFSSNKGGSETYSAQGQLLVATDAIGNNRTYTYVDGKLNQVTNHYGKQLTFIYTNSVISSVVDAAGNAYHYEYDSNNNLVSVTYPDQTPGDASDNPKRIYHYENANFPNHLIGITDENGERYARYAYDENGKAIVTEHAQTTNAVPQERFELNYND